MKRSVLIGGIVTVAAVSALYAMGQYQELTVYYAAPIVIPVVVDTAPKEREVIVLEDEVKDVSYAVTLLATLTRAAANREASESVETKSEEPVVASEPAEVTVPLESPQEQFLTAASLGELGYFLHTFTNEERLKRGLDPLSYDAALESVATEHSVDMGTRDYLDHTSPDGCNYTCRLQAAGYQALVWGENIIWREGSSTPTPAVLAKDFMKSWMASGGHRENILSVDYKQQGIGVYQSGEVVYVTVNFARTD